MQDEEIGTTRIGRTLDRHSRSKDNGICPMKQLVLLTIRKQIGDQRNQQETYTGKETDLLQSDPFGEKEEHQATDEEHKGGNSHLAQPSAE